MLGRSSELPHPCDLSGLTYYTGCGVVPLEARSARHRWNLPRRTDPHLEHLHPFKYAVTSAGGDNRNPQQRVLPTVVSTRTGAAQHARLRLARPGAAARRA